MEVDPYDEPDLDGEDVVIRRVNPDQHLVKDESTGKLRTSSKLFTPSSGPKGGMSVDVLKLIESDGLDPREFVTTPVFIGSVAFKARAARDAGLRIGYEPIVDVPGVDDNPYHGEVWGGQEKPNRFSRGQKRELAAASTWFVALPDVEIKI